MHSSKRLPTLSMAAFSSAIVGSRIGSFMKEVLFHLLTA
jgi:hypothetical protein